MQGQGGTVPAISAEGLSVSGLFDLSGRTALVTGASRGIGATIARALDGAGAQVVICARDMTQLHALSGALDNDPVVVRADLATPNGVSDLLVRVAEVVPRVDILVNNAGMQTGAPSTEITDDEWDAVIGINLRASFQLARSLLPAMAKAGWGRVINVASILGLVGETCAADYVTSKAGMVGMTRALAAEWSATGIGVNALCPGWIDTSMVADVKSNPSFDRRVLRRTPVGRWGRPEDLIGPIVFLASRASDFMVGQTLVVDGGLTACW